MAKKGVKTTQEARQQAEGQEAAPATIRMNRMEAPSAESLGLAGMFAEPDDQGLSLEEFGQAYASLMGGNTAAALDPYPDSLVDLPSLDDDLLADPADDQDPTGPFADANRRVIAAADDAACEITPRTILEAILFVGHPQNEPLASKQIAGLMRGVRPEEIDELIVELNQQYLSEGVPYEVQSVGAGYRLTIRNQFAPLRDKFYGRVKEAKLSQAAVDCLAIVAYNQPVSLDEIDRIRNKPSSGILAQLVRRDLLAIQRPAEKKESPSYSTTNRFLELFALENLADLPQVERNL